LTLRQVTDDDDLLQLLIRSRPESVAGEPAPEEALPGDDAAARPLPTLRNVPERSLQETIFRRRSGGWIAGASLDASVIGALLVGLADALPAALADVPPVFCLLLFSVDGFEEGAYRYLPAGHALVPVAPLEREAARHDLLLQSDHADAAAIILHVVPLARWLHLYGDQGYRIAVLQAGWVSDRLYLRAEALRLRYTASGGFAPVVVDSLLGMHGYGLTALFGFVVGASDGQR
jgi:SagB-type dehydrogenase family enzyme